MDINEYKAASRVAINNIVASTRNWLQRGLKRVLQPLLSQFLGKRSVVKDINLDVGNMSYTDKRSVVVSLTEEEACTMSRKEQATVVKFKLYHEMSHILWTDDSQYRNGIFLIGDIVDSYARSKGFIMLVDPLFHLGADLMNCIEDGRIENILCNQFSGLKKHRDWYRLSQWKKFNCLDYNPPGLYEEARNAVLDLATIGLLPQGFTVKFPTSGNFCKTVLDCCEDIANYVMSNTIKDGLPFVEGIARKLAPYIVAEYGLAEDEYEELQKSGRNSKYTEEQLREIAERAARDAQNHKDRQPQPGSPTPQNGPIVSVLTDDEDEEGEETGEGQKPDVVVDLRKAPPKSEKSENNEEDSPYYYRPEGIEDEKGENEEESKNESGNSETSDGGSSEGNEGGSSNSSEEDKNEENSSDSGLSENGGDKEEESSSTPGSSDEESGDEEESSSSSDSSKDHSSSKENKGDKADSLNSENVPDCEDCGNEEEAGKSESSESSSENRENKGKTEASPNSEYHLPNPEDFTKAVNDSLNEVEDALETEVLSEVKRANKEEKSWEISEGQAMPLSKENVNSLASDFGGSKVDVVDYRNNPAAITSCPTDIQVRGRRLAAKIDKIVKAKSSPARRDCRTGLVDTTNLGKFISGQTDFYRQDAVNKPIDIACMVLKDDSGSMYGPNEETALEVLSEIEECFKKLDKNIKLRMQAFSNRYNETMKVIKDFDDCDKSRSYTYSFHRQSCPGGGNNDAFSIALATDILAQRKEKSKLMIVVSDGAPCCSTELVKKAVARARSKGIFVISVLIGSQREVQNNWNLFQSMYEQNLLAGSLDNMGDQMFKFIKKFVASL